MCVGDGNKKSVGVVSSALIPVVRPSHCPQVKDKQRKPAHAKRLYTHATAWYTLIIIYMQIHTYTYNKSIYAVQGYNPRAQTLSVALPLYLRSKLRSLTTQTVTLENAFRGGANT